MPLSMACDLSSYGFFQRQVRHWIWIQRGTPSLSKFYVCVGEGDDLNCLLSRIDDSFFSRNGLGRFSVFVIYFMRAALAFV